MFHQKQREKANSGMTIIEVIFAIVLLLILVTTAASMIRNGIDLKMAISDQAKATHKLTIAMQKLTDDLQHAYVLNRKRVELFYASRMTKALFSLETRGGSARLSFTTKSHRPLRANAKESDMNFVIYELERDKDSEFLSLYRGESKVLPVNFEEKLQMHLLAKHVKTFRVSAWDGSRWKEDWNSDKAEHRDLIPRMLKVELEIYETPAVEEVVGAEMNDLPTQFLQTIIYTQGSRGIKQAKQPSKRIKYE